MLNTYDDEYHSGCNFKSSYLLELGGIFDNSDRTF